MTRDTAERAREWLVRQDSRFHHESYMPETVARLAASYTQIQAEAREQLATWMVEHSFSTGHGDTFEDLLKELDWQVKEMRGARLEEAKEIRKHVQSSHNDSIGQYFEKRIAALAQALQLEEKEGES